MALEIYQYTYNPGTYDNYGVLMHDPETGQTVCVDTGDATETLNALDKTGWTLSHIWITHHDHDHIDGLEEVKAKTGAHVIGPDYPAKIKITGLDVKLKGGDEFEFSGRKVKVFHTPGHADDMLNFYLPDENIFFASDTLFVMGCGRLTDGTPQQMWESFQIFFELPKDTIIYSAHEYTASNIAFAKSVDETNAALHARAENLLSLLENGEPTTPAMLSDEFATNPFLRANDPDIRKYLGMEQAQDVEVFAELRKRKDNF